MEIIEVVGNLLDRDEIEPAEYLSDQPMVFLPSILNAEVGDVPRRDEQMAAPAGWNASELLVLAQGGDLGFELVVERRPRLAKRRHVFRRLRRRQLDAVRCLPAIAPSGVSERGDRVPDGSRASQMALHNGSCPYHR